MSSTAIKYEPSLLREAAWPATVAAASSGVTR